MDESGRTGFHRSGDGCEKTRGGPLRRADDGTAPLRGEPHRGAVRLPGPGSLLPEEAGPGCAETTLGRAALSQVPASCRRGYTHDNEPKESTSCWR